MKKAIIRILISIGLLVWLFSRIDIKAVGNLIININPLIYIASMGILFIHQYVWSCMWGLALRQKGYSIRHIDVYRTVLTSYFFGTFLPSSIGPDIVLTFNIGRTLKEKEHAPSSLLFVRLMGISGTLLISGILLMFIAYTTVLRQIRILTWLLLLAVWIFYWLAIHPRSRKFIQRSPRFLYKILHSFSLFGVDPAPSYEVFNSAGKTCFSQHPHSKLWDFWGRCGIDIKIWILGIVMTFLKTLIDYTIALSLGIHIPYIYFLGLIPSIAIVSLLPISIAGLGVREGAYVGIFSNMGIPPANSLSISLIVFTLNICLCIIGGILYLVQGTRLKIK